jgi:REP element-mobilizing transposase RayT
MHASPVAPNFSKKTRALHGASVVNGLESPFSLVSFFDSSAFTSIHTRNLPHWQQGGVWTFVTWRLGDSLPQSKLRELEHEKQIWLGFHPKPWSAEIEQEYHQRFHDRVDEWLDQGVGSCLLRTPDNAAVVSGALRHFDGARYRLGSWVVMPNHVHVLFQPMAAHDMADIVQSWKGFAARMINKRERRNGPLWQPEYWDRLIRTQEHFAKCAEYIVQNPAKARLKQGEFVLS